MQRLLKQKERGSGKGWKETSRFLLLIWSHRERADTHAHAHTRTIHECFIVGLIGWPHDTVTHSAESTPSWESMESKPTLITVDVGNRARCRFRCTTRVWRTKSRCVRLETMVAQLRRVAAINPKGKSRRCYQMKTLFEAVFQYLNDVYGDVGLLYR